MSFYPVLTSLEMRRIEQLAIREGCNEEAFMAEAGHQIALRVLYWIEHFHLPKQIVLLIGKGNKGGDAYVAGIHLLEKGIKVRAVTVSGRVSPLNQKFKERFLMLGGSLSEDKSFDQDALIVDGLLGTGFLGKVESQFSEIILAANASGKPILSIDIPSGLDGSTGVVIGDAIIANETVTLGALKLGFFLKDGWNCVGSLRLADFGLPKGYLEKANRVAKIPKNLFMPPIVRNRHKYEAGYVVGLSGSKLFRGAPKLAGLSALRTGAGIVRVFHLDEALGEAPFSLIFQKWNGKSWKEEIQRASAVFIGPGIGKATQFLKQLKNLKQPLVVDADAIQKGVKYPRRAILTPHRGEVHRLIGKVSSEPELFDHCQKWVDQTGCILVLKGAPTWIFSQNDVPTIIPPGDPGMAKAGTGDVLTGMIAALLAQKMDPLEAAILGCQLHAEAGKIAAQEKTSYCMIAEDIIDCLPRTVMKHRHSVVRFKPLNKTQDSFL